MLNFDSITIFRGCINDISHYIQTFVYVITSDFLNNAINQMLLLLKNV